MPDKTTDFYVLVQANKHCLCLDFFDFGFYAQENNLDEIQDFVIWLGNTAVEGEEEWLNDSSPDKCGLHEWLESDDPFKNDPTKSKRVRDYLNSFSILRATPRLKQFCMEYQKMRKPIPYILSEDGRADLDVAALKRRRLFEVNGVKIVECLEVNGCAAALNYVKKLEGVHDDLELAGLLGIPLDKISAICQPAHFLRFFDEHYPYGYEAYLKAKFDERDN